MSLKEYVNRYYETYIDDKDFSYAERWTWLWLSSFYTGTFKRFKVLEWTKLDRSSDTIEVWNTYDRSIKLTFILNWASPEVIVRRDNRTEIVDDLREFVDLLYRLW